MDMTGEPLVFTPIGVVHSPFIQAAGTPIQPPRAKDCVGTVEMFPEFVPGLADLAGYDRIWLLFWCHRACQARMIVIPYRDTRTRGLFATRAPARPNPIGMSAVRLLRIEGGTLHIADLDLLDGTPLVDVKPYVAEYDAYPDAGRGWLDDPSVLSGPVRADGRFER